MSESEHSKAPRDAARQQRPVEPAPQAGGQQATPLFGPEFLLTLQRTVGNQEVNNLLRRYHAAHTAPVRLPLADPPDAGRMALQRATVIAPDGVGHEEDENAFTTDATGAQHDAAGNVVTFRAPDGVYVEEGAASQGGGQQQGSDAGASGGQQQSNDGGASGDQQQSSDASSQQQSADGGAGGGQQQSSDGGASGGQQQSMDGGTDGGQQQSTDGGQQSTLSSNGPALSSGEQPASFQVGGLPSFRYNAPSVPIATAHVETPEASIDLSLLLRGSLTATFQNSVRGGSFDIDQGAFRVEASRAVDGIVQGLRVNGIGGQQLSIGATVGTEFAQSEVRFIPPNTMAFIGQARVAFTRDTPVGQLTMTGQPGFELRVTVTPHLGPPQLDPVPIDEESWFSRHAGALAAVGVVILVVAAVALAPETGGGSLMLLGAT